MLVTPYLLQRRRPRCHVKAALAWAGEGVGGQLLALSWKWSTGPAEFQRHKSPHRQVLGHRYPPGLFITYWKCHSWENHAQESPQEACPAQWGPSAAPRWVTGGVQLPHLTPCCVPWSQVGFRVQALVSMFVLALSRQPCSVVQTW